MVTPHVTLAEWWRGRSDRRDELLRGLLVEPLTDDVMTLAGLTLAKLEDATTVDAIVAPFAARRSGIVYTADAEDFRALGRFFPALRVVAV